MDPLTAWNSLEFQLFSVIDSPPVLFLLFQHFFLSKIDLLSTVWRAWHLAVLNWGKFSAFLRTLTYRYSSHREAYVNKNDTGIKWNALESVVSVLRSAFALSFISKRTLK